MKIKFADSLSHAEWLDDKTRIQLLQKTDQILLSFRSNDSDEMALLKKYENLALKANEYPQNLDSVMTTNRLSFYALYGTEFSAKHVYV